jgi:DNA-binding GntR family transcriptional regulator
MGPATRDLSIREKAYLHIQQQIANGNLAAGSGISELSLAKELGSSRSPIREAMNQLAAEGLLEQNSGGGMQVARLKRNDIVELYDLREALELERWRRLAESGRSGCAGVLRVLVNLRYQIAKKGDGDGALRR